jgi:hypothetical protein
MNFDPTKLVQPTLGLRRGALFAVACLAGLCFELGPVSAQDAEPIVTHHQILYNNGTPVGGYVQLTIYPDGSYEWEGHAHDSGATSYNFSTAAVVHTVSGKTYSFSQTGRLHGTFESGSRTSEWHTPGESEDLAELFWEIDDVRINFSTSLTFSSLIDDLTKGLAIAGSVIAIVAAL